MGEKVNDRTIKIKDWLIDLDNCLYPYDNGLYNYINLRMNHYIEKKLMIPFDQVDQLRRSFIATFGNTLLGLILHHQVEAHDFLNYVHDFPLDPFISREPLLCSFLEQHLSGRFIIFTNAPGFYAHRVLQALGIDHLVHQVYDIHFSSYYGKPHPESFEKVIREAELSPCSTLFVDDMPENVNSAKKMGFQTLHIDTSIPYKNNYYIDLFFPGVLRCLKKKVQA
jgi:putative hydrolase of the HAD superfamily